jgi:hypothetical protein
MSRPPHPELAMIQRPLLFLPLLLALGCPPTNGKPDDTGPTTGCTDADGDGFCEDEDCDDGDPDIHPEVDEASMGPDEVDNDCDGVLDECDDDDPERTWHAEELCDGIDNDCDGEIDEDLGGTWYPDEDGDGYGDGGRPVQSCDPDAGLVQDDSDCDDGDPTVHPGAQETCNGVDDDCDSTTLEEGLITLEGSGNQASIQDALSAAAEGDTVTVCPGSYEGSFTIARGLTLHAPHGAERTELVGDGAASVIRVAAGAVTLSGFTIRGGVGTDISSESDNLGGGGVLGWNADELLVEDCVITGNQADFGGGILGPAEGLLTVRRSSITSNHASSAGGGLYVLEGLLESVELVDNSSASSGGGIYHYQNALTLNDVTITDNAAGYGGGIRAFDDSIEATDTLIEGNQAEYGGGIYMRNDPIISGVRIRGNSADRGAGVYCREDGTLLDSVVEANEAASYGGGVMCRDGATLLERVEILDSVAIGGAGLLLDSCDLQLDTVLVRGGVADYGGGAYLVDGQLEAGADVRVVGNDAAIAGGGAYVYSNSSWDGGEVSGNSADSGGGLYLYGIGVLDGITVSGNSATEWGGGVMVVSESDLEDLVLDGNQANYGGGLYIYGTGQVAMSGATVTNNVATERGGGLRVAAGLLEITASDLGSAKVDNSPDDIYAGGSAYTNLDTVESMSCSGSDGCS